MLICSELVTDICGQLELLRNLGVLPEFRSKRKEVWTDSHPFPGKASAPKEFISPPFLAVAMEKPLRQNKEACRVLKRLATGMHRNIHPSEKRVDLQEYTGAQSLERLWPQEVILRPYVRSIVQPHNIPLCD